MRACGRAAMARLGSIAAGAVNQLIFDTSPSSEIPYAGPTPDCNPDPDSGLHLQVPWSIRRGPSYWEDRLREHCAQLGVTVTEAYQRSDSPRMTPN